MTNAELAELALARRERLARHLARRAPQGGRDLTGVDFTSGPYHNQPLDLATAVEELLHALTRLEAVPEACARCQGAGRLWSDGRSRVVSHVIPCLHDVVACPACLGSGRAAAQ